MLDITLRPLKDGLFEPLCDIVPRTVTPTQITATAFIAGLGCCVSATTGHPFGALALWTFNRSLDCLDGAVARRRGQTSDLGGFLDLLSDFLIYAAIPICCTLGTYGATETRSSEQRRWLAVALAEASFYVNNFILFFIAAVVEKRKTDKIRQRLAEEDKVKELTTVNMRPALVEGFESGLAFTLMIAMPQWTEAICWVLSMGIAIGIAQRTLWAVQALGSS